MNRIELSDFIRATGPVRTFVIMTYMTGILPIAKYSSGSELNMFWEYNMASETKYSEYFGFTDDEVDELFDRYEHNNENTLISRQDLRTWYDGYTTKSGMMDIQQSLEKESIIRDQLFLYLRTII